MADKSILVVDEVMVNVGDGVNAGVSTSKVLSEENITIIENNEDDSEEVSDAEAQSVPSFDEDTARDAVNKGLIEPWIEKNISPVNGVYTLSSAIGKRFAEERGTSVLSAQGGMRMLSLKKPEKYSYERKFTRQRMGKYEKWILENIPCVSGEYRITLEHAKMCAQELNVVGKNAITALTNLTFKVGVNYRYVGEEKTKASVAEPIKPEPTKPEPTKVKQTAGQRRVAWVRRHIEPVNSVFHIYDTDVSDYAYDHNVSLLSAQQACYAVARAYDDIVIVHKQGKTEKWVRKMVIPVDGVFYTDSTTTAEQYAKHFSVNINRARDDLRQLAVRKPMIVYTNTKTGRIYGRVEDDVDEEAIEAISERLEDVAVNV